MRVESEPKRCAEIVKRETKSKLCWWGIAAYCGFLALANLMVPLSTVHSRSRTNQRISDLQSAGDRPVSAQELHDALVDVQAIYLASLRFLDINFYLPAIIFVIAVVGSQLAIPKRKKSAQPSTKADGLKPAP